MADKAHPGRGSARERILVAALEIIAAEGIDAVSHRAVAARAGVSPGSTTHHFASRTDLIREAFRYYLSEADLTIRSLDDPTITDTAERITELLCAVVDEEFTDHGLVRAEYELLLFAARDETLATDVRVWESRNAAELSPHLEELGAPRPVEAARILMNLMRGYELERLTNPVLTTAVFRRRIGTVLAAFIN